MSDSIKDPYSPMKDFLKVYHIRSVNFQNNFVIPYALILTLFLTPINPNTNPNLNFNPFPNPNLDGVHIEYSKVLPHFQIQLPILCHFKILFIIEGVNILFRRVKSAYIYLEFTLPLQEFKFLKSFTMCGTPMNLSIMCSNLYTPTSNSLSQ